MTSARSGLSLHALALMGVATIVVYFIGFAVFLTFRVTPQAIRLPQRTAPILVFFEQLSRRNAMIESSMLVARQAIADGSVGRMDSLARAIADKDLQRSLFLSDVPLNLRSTMANSERLEGEIETQLVEIAALMALQRLDEARTRMRAVDSLHSDFANEVVSSEREGFAEMNSMQMELADAVGSTISAMLAWVALGALLVLITTGIVRRRAARPLAELDRALTAVAEGDLNVRIPVQYDDEMGELSAHFNVMTEVLRARAEEQGRFAAAGQLIAGVAHEVNNPLMAIAAVAKTRLDAGGLDPMVEAELGQIRRQAQRAGRLLSGLLRFVRSDPGTAAVTDMNQVVDAAVDLVSYRFGVDEIVLELALEPNLPTVAGSPARLEQVFVNLISNAADAMMHAPRPRILEIATWERGGVVGASVSDRGGGVAADMKARLFLPFATTKGTEGTGLGLYISRQVVRDAGGDLAYRDLGEGSCFEVRLPVLAAAAPTKPPAMPERSPPAKPLDGLHILLVDDELAVRSPIARFLRRRGADVSEAADGLVALEMIRQRAPAVIVADLRMPRMDGVELCARIAQDFPALADRIVILSGDLSQLGSQLPVPAHLVLAKPVELDEIERAILEVGERLLA